MKTIISREISALVFRPTTKTSTAPSTSASASDNGPNIHARYYSVITLNQITLTPSDQVVAGLLVDLYFKLFEEILHEGARNEKINSKTPKPDVLDDDDDETGGGKKKGTKRDRNGKFKAGKGGATKGKGKGPELVATDGFTEVEDSDSKTISAILTGVNRAMPFAKPDDST